MPVIWGFDLSHMSWGAFGHRKMFDRRWHLRRERFIVYQLAMLICLAAECTATYSLAKYQSQQDNIESINEDAAVHNNDLIAAQCLTIVFCVFVATLFGADFFFLVFWPSRRYPYWYNVIKKFLAVGITTGVTAAAFMSTIVVASHGARITGVSLEQAEQYERLFFRPPLRYKDWAVNIAYVVLLWIGLVFTFASTVLLFKADKHVERYGAEPMWEEGEKDPRGVSLTPPN
ncbi:hypothetical protein BDZ94DRAFT_1308769 [Collybia nuda]|uniref:Uncharacterized protein n=1 Tax=Collybia nuda TaxID=64659 RepID=A0A9P6CK39_9AGAR|nr:hypothetical protein BDZ94DRAFT_1308769 [Collybia nuda]